MFKGIRIGWGKLGPVSKGLLLVFGALQIPVLYLILIKEMLIDNSFLYGNKFSMYINKSHHFTMLKVIVFIISRIKCTISISISIRDV